MEPGLLITFEGGEGCGKSTQIRRLEAHLIARGREVVVTREPGGTPLGEAVRDILLDHEHEPDGLTELFLLSAARRELVQTVIRPALTRGALVLSDRYADSSRVYQGIVRGVDRAIVDELVSLATGGLEPDLTIVLDLDPAVGVERAHGRDEAANRIDAESAAFHRRVRDGFVELVRTGGGRFALVDADGDETEVFARIRAVLPEEVR